MRKIKTRMELIEALLTGEMLYNKTVNKYYVWKDDKLQVRYGDTGPWKNSQLVLNMNLENFVVLKQPTKVVAHTYMQGETCLGDIFFSIEGSLRCHQYDLSKSHRRIEVTPDMVVGELL